jgi:hypothetical protein
MSRNSGKKRLARKGHKTKGKRPPVLTIPSLFRPREDTKDFVNARDALERIFVRYTATSVHTALLASELWIPNLGGHVRQLFAWRVFMSVPTDAFAGVVLDDDAAFAVFLAEVHATIPTFPVLEDFIPEADWGALRLDAGTAPSRLLTGSSLERETDYVAAFQMLYAYDADALADMAGVIALHGLVLDVLPRPDDGTPPEKGMLRVPPTAFWHATRALTAQLATAARTEVRRDALIARLGTVPALPNVDAFSNEIYGEGRAYVALAIGEQVLPFALRQAPCAVIDFWHDHAPRQDAANLADIACEMAAYLNARQDDLPLTPGPFRFDGAITPDGIHVVALGEVGGQLHIHVLVHEDGSQRLQILERAIRTVFTAGKPAEWRLTGNDHRRLRIVSPRRRNTAPEIVFIVIPARVTTRAMMPPSLPTYARLVPLADWVCLVDELDSAADMAAFFAFLKESEKRVFGFSGLIDFLATFRFADQTLIEGNEQPNMIMLQPLAAGAWRYEKLASFWETAPRGFPSGPPRGWRISQGRHAILMRSRTRRQTSAAVQLGSMTLHLMVSASHADDDLDKLRILHTIAECLAEALGERSDLIGGHPVLKLSRALIHLSAPGKEQMSGNGGLVPRTVGVRSGLLVGRFDVDLDQMRERMMDARDATGEVLNVSEFLVGLATVMHEEMGANVLNAIQATASNQPLCGMYARRATSSSPEDYQAIVPAGVDYKRARRELAIMATAQGVVPGKLEIAAAKATLNPLRDAYRDRVHELVAHLDKAKALPFALAQLDSLLTTYERNVSRVEASRSHQVNYDRYARVLEVRAEFAKNAATYRYLIECLLSQPSVNQPDRFSEDAFLATAAAADWLLVLQQASDAIHYDLLAVGVEFADNLVPTVSYAEERTPQALDGEFARDLLSEDDGPAASLAGLTAAERKSQNEALREDAGFTLSTLLRVLEVLAYWTEGDGPDSRRPVYQAEDAAVMVALANEFADTAENEYRAALTFVTLDPEHIRRLVGSSIVERDVPTWEYRKRLHRVTLRPLVPMGGSMLAWSPASVARARMIWAWVFENGVIPGDFPWPRAEAVSAAVKKRLEHDLEVRCLAAVRPFAPHSDINVNVAKRFRDEGFLDVGDYDVLAWIPQADAWLTVECKYNKTPFTLKDSRRLRDEMFGEPKGQIPKIERRTHYLQEHGEVIRRRMGWPARTTVGEERSVRVIDLYVCPSVQYWMRNPPRKTDVTFVSLRALSAWLETHLPPAP